MRIRSLAPKGFLVEELEADVSGGKNPYKQTQPMPTQKGHPPFRETEGNSAASSVIREILYPVLWDEKSPAKRKVSA